MSTIFAPPRKRKNTRKCKPFAQQYLQPGVMVWCGMLCLVVWNWVLLLQLDITRAALTLSRARAFSPTSFIDAMNEHSSDIKKTTLEMIADNGYPAEPHMVTTDDGYILEVHRIPSGKMSYNSSSSSSRPVAILHHCLLCSSSVFIMNTPDKALAYLLADSGYDVWLTNARGNTYSKRHKTLSPSDKDFWQFSWHEMGVYDLPAVIDYVLAATESQQLNYIGFSMGTTVFWTMLSEKPQYADKIRLMIALGPVAYVQHVQGPFRLAAPFVNIIERSLRLLGQYEMLSFGPVMDRLLAVFCDEDVFTSVICQNTLFLLTGPNPSRLNKKFLPVILAHTPAGTSVRTVTHYLQEVNSGRFCQYDHGHFGNIAHYGTLAPPAYNLSHVRCPVALFWSYGDWLAGKEDVHRLQVSLPNVIHSSAVSDATFTHLDFVWAVDAKELVYNDVLKLLKSYHKG